MGRRVKTRSWFAIVGAILCFTFLSGFLNASITVPSTPSEVRVDGTQLKIKHARQDATLKAEEVFVMKGVAWSVAQRFPVETYLPGAPFANDNRVRMQDMAAHDFPRIREAGFNTVRLYMDPGLAEDSSLYYDADDSLGNQPSNWETDTLSDYFGETYTVGWFQSWLEGMPLIGDMTATSDDDGLAVLDEAYKNGLKVIMIVDGGNGNLDIAKRMIATYKNHPALLLWMIGNEFNYETHGGDGSATDTKYMFRFPHFYDNSTEIDSAIEAAQNVANWIQSNDTKHPVAACLAEPSVAEAVIGGVDKTGYEAYKAAVDHLTDVDLFGLNIYRGISFKNLYEEWTGSNYINSSKPIFISEYGVDTWHYDASVANEYKDSFSQLEGTGWQWSDLHAHLSAQDEDNIIVGGVVFEWVDEWWKLKGSDPLKLDTDPGYPVNLGLPPSVDLYPDGTMHEEHWGITAQDVTSANPVQFYSDYGLLGELAEGNQSWDIYSWGLPVDGAGYGILRGQADYITSSENIHGVGSGVRDSFLSYYQYHYTGGTGTGNDIPEGTRCLYTEIFANKSYGGGWGLFRTGETIDLTEFAGGTLKFWIKIKQSDGSAIGSTIESDFYLKFEDDKGPAHAVYVWLDGDQDQNGTVDTVDHFSEFNPSSTDWQELSIPLDVLIDDHVFKDDKGTSKNAQLNLSKMKMVFSITSEKVRTGEPNTYFWVDDVRWHMKDAVSSNRRAEPALAAFRDDRNTLVVSKTAFEVLAHSDTTSSDIAGILKNKTTVIGDWSSNDPGLDEVLAVAFDTINGDIVEWTDLDSATAVNNFIGTYDDVGDHYVLAFVVNDSCGFLGSASSLSSIGSSLYSSVDAGEPWVFVTEIKDGSSLAAKESQGANNVAQVTLACALDRDGDGTVDVIDTDRDGDGLSDADERRYGTNILDADTDDDGTNDNSEVTNATNPRNVDSKNLATDTQAKLVVHPHELTYSFTDEERYLYIHNDGGESLDYKVDVSYTDGSGWISVKYRDHSSDGAWTGVTTGTYGLYDDLDDHVLQLSIDRSSMTSSITYDATITITAKDEDGTASGSQVIDVVVPNETKLQVEPAELKVQKPDTTALIHITNPGGGTLSWDLTENESWLSLSSTSGTTTTEVDTITATVDWSSAGDFATAQIEVDAGNDGLRYINIEANNRTQLDYNSTLAEADASYMGVLRQDFRETECIATGDVNGDGYEDVLIGALQYYQADDDGRAYLIFGKPGGWKNDQSILDAVKFYGNRNYGDLYVGTGVALADVNGDGLDDVIIGDKMGNYQMSPSNSNWTGRLFIFFGKAEGWQPQHQVSTDADSMITAENYYYDDFAEKIASGDFDDDGYDDLLVSADNNVDNSYIIYGQSSGWPSLPARYTSTWDNHIQNIDHDVTKLDRPDGTLRCRWVTAGDINGDDIQDAVLSTFTYVSSAYEQNIYILYGQSGGWGTTLDLTTDADVTINLDSLYVSNAGWYTKVNADGDVNGDGYDDLLFGNGLNYSGNPWDKVYLILGGSSLSSSMSMPGAEDGSFVTFGTAYGNYRVANMHIAQDMNNDGYDEIVHGDTSGGGSYVFDNRGYTHVFFGKSSGWTTEVAASNADIRFSNETPTIDGGNDTAGSNPIGSGDLDGDGRGDLIVVKGWADQGVVDSGQAYIFLGRPFGVTSTEVLMAKTGSTTESKTVYVLNRSLDDTEDVSWTASESESWITSLSATSGTIEDDDTDRADPITINVDRTNLGDGTYRGYVTISSGGVDEYIEVMLVVGDYNANDKPLLGSDAEHIYIQDTDTSETVGLTNDGGGVLSYTIIEGESWITSVSPSSGTITSETDTITVNVSRSGVSSDQTGKITVITDEFSKDIYVTMED